MRSLWCSWAENKIRSNILKLEQRWGVAVLRPTAIAKWGVHPASTSPMEMVGKNKKKLRKHRVKSVATPKHELKNWQFMAKQENLATNIDKLEQNRHTQRAQ